MIGRLARALGATLLWVVVALCLVITFVPPFLDHIYYDGPVSDHYDGAHFANPDGETLSPFPPGRSRTMRLAAFMLGMDDRPDWPEEVRVTQARPVARLSGDAMRATWVGHSTFLVQAGGVNILTDPIWSEYASPLPGAGPRRIAAPGIAFDDLPRIDIVIVSHNHYDHMDLPTLRRLWERDRPLIVSSLGNDVILAGEGITARALDWGQSVAHAGARVHVTRNHHWSSRWGADRNRALWSSFVVETGAGNIFFAGDTGAGDMRWADDVRRIGPVRLALIPIGAFRFMPGQMDTGSHIGPAQAVELFTRLNASEGIAMHWGTFRMSNEGYDTPPRMMTLHLGCAGIEPGRFRAIALGQARDIGPYRPVARGKGDPAPCAPTSPQMRALP